MEKTNFIEAQIVFALRQVDASVTIAEVCHERGISEAYCYKWKKMHGGIGAGLTHQNKTSAFTAFGAVLQPVVAARFSNQLRSKRSTEFLMRKLLT